MRNRAGAASDDARAQTTLDFAIGVSVFLAVILFVFLFVPGLLSPFTQSTQSETVSSDRVADQLTKGMLGSPRRPYVLDEYCTVQFFANESAEGCGFEDQTALERQFGFESATQHINVTVRGNASTTTESDDLLCWDADDEMLVDVGTNCDSTDTPLTRGEEPPATNDASVTALRVALLHGQDVTVYVEMW